MSQDPLPPGPAPPPRRLNATWQDGVFLTTDDGDYQIRIGSLIRFDSRFAPTDPGDVVTDTFTMRVLRATFQGRIARYFTFRLSPDFTGGTSTVADAYIDIGFSDAFHVRIGRDKTPVSFEVLLQDANVLFIERGLTSNLSPSRDVGVQLYGDLPGGFVSYAGGVFNGVVDGTSSTNTDSDSSKDFIGRIVVRPWDNASRSHPLQRLGLAFAGTTGLQNAALPSFRTSVQQQYFSYARDAVADGRRTRLSPQVFYYYKHFGAFAEYARSRQGVTRGAAHADVSNTAWQVDLSYLPTGETAGERVRPRRAFDPERRTWGAVQLTGRVSALNVDRDVMLRFADAGAAGKVSVVTAGVNWYMTTNVKSIVNVERTVFDGNPNGPRGAEHGILARLQLNY